MSVLLFLCKVGLFKKLPYPVGACTFEIRDGAAKLDYKLVTAPVGQTVHGFCKLRVPGLVSPVF